MKREESLEHRLGRGLRLPRDGFDPNRLLLDPISTPSFLNHLLLFSNAFERKLLMKLIIEEGEDPIYSFSFKKMEMNYLRGITYEIGIRKRKLGSDRRQEGECCCVFGVCFIL